MSMLDDVTINRLKKLAACETMNDVEGNVYECSGGNFDDAYELGKDDGETELAREILSCLKITWV